MIRSEDRGLDLAWERFTFTQWLAALARRHEITRAVEGPWDGARGIAGVHGVALAASGVHVTSLHEDPGAAEVARAVYERHGGAAWAVEPADARTPEAELAVLYDALDDAAWRDRLESAMARTKKLLVVTVSNPDHWRAGPTTPSPRELAPALWRCGRVIEHARYHCPWWPVGTSPPWGRGLRFDASRWPYADRDAWTTLWPSLLREPSFEGASAKVVTRMAHRIAYVVDVRPRKAGRKVHLPLAP